MMTMKQVLGVLKPLEGEEEGQGTAAGGATATGDISATGGVIFAACCSFSSLDKSSSIFLSAGACLPCSLNSLMIALLPNSWPETIE